MIEDFKSSATLKGSVVLERISANGEVDVRANTNTVTNAGKAQVAGLILSDVAGTAFDYLALGTSSTAPAASQTALGGFFASTAGTGTRTTVSVTNDTAQLSCSFSIGSTATLREIGIFNATGGTGTMLARATFSDLAVNNGDTVNAVYKLQVA